MDTTRIGNRNLLLAFCFMSMFSLANQLSAQGPCDFIKFTLDNYQPCCYRLHVDNLTECHPELRLLIDVGTYESFQANISTGWTCTKVSPTELLLKHNSGKVPIGASIPVTFCLQPGFDPLLSILWDNSCVQLACFFDIPLTGCPIVADACITGVKYRECDQVVYSNQTLIPNFIINLFDDKGLFIASAVTDSAGEYSFCDLAPGNYVVSEVNQKGWTPVFPSHGRFNVTLLQSEIATRNFGNCPVCSCDSIFIDLVEDGGEPDSCSYTLVIQNTGGYCFQNINFRSTSVKGSKSNTDDRILEPGWTINQIDSQNQVLIPPGGYIPIGISYPLKLYIGNGEIFIKATTYYSIGGNLQECSKDFSFICPRKKPPTNCCLNGIPGPELIINGNFEMPGPVPQGFTSCFDGPYIPGPGNTPSGRFYAVLNSTEVFGANSQWACIDHTANSPTGRVFVADGVKPTCNSAWQEIVNVQKGVQYNFCAFANNLVIPTRDFTDPILELWIDGVQVQSINLPEIPDQWQSLNTTWTAAISGPVLIEIRLTPQVNPGNDFALDDISFRSCNTDTCICGSFDLQYSIGRGPLLPYDCGDTLYVPSSTAIVPIHFLSSFACLGTNCPQTTVDLILTGPPGFIPVTISGVQANPDFIIPFTNATFSIAGLYTLTMNGHCGNTICPCTIYFKADGHDCCSNQFDFELGISNAVTITLDSIKCKATLNIGNLPKCDSIGPIFWGDGTSSTGPFIAGTMPMHTYTGSGNYFITWTATEYDYSVMPPRKCFEKIFRDSIKLNCDTCQCKSFSSMVFANFNWTTPNIPVACGQNSVQLPCAKPGQNFWLHGYLNCNAPSCMRDSLNWSVALINGPTIAYGTATYFNPSDGHFDIYLNPGLFNPNVQYEIIVTGNCGSKLCKCNINFSFAPCLCLCGNIIQEASQGFYVSGNTQSCKRTIKPIALCAKDIVTWLVTPAITPAPANSIGNNSQVFNFTIPGVYTVCMVVNRIDDNSNSCSDSYCKKVTVNCSPHPYLRLCETNALQNGDFSEGLSKGELSKSELAKAGKIDDWRLFPNIGEGQVIVEDSSGASDDGSVILIGNKSNFAGIWQQVDLGVDSFINIGFDIINYRLDSNLLGAEIVFRLQSDSTLNAINKVDILRKKVMRDEKDKNYLQNNFSINYQHNPDLKYLVICLQNQSDTAYSIIGIDNIEMCTSKIPLSTNSDQLGKLRIFPNPSTGHFIVEMQQVAASGMKFRIMDLNGRMVLENQTVIGNQIQNIDASSLASGFYFLQVVSDGKVLAVEKLMKQ